MNTLIIVVVKDVDSPLFKIDATENVHVCTINALVSDFNSTPYRFDLPRSIHNVNRLESEFLDSIYQHCVLPAYPTSVSRAITRDATSLCLLLKDRRVNEGGTSSK
jgi:hypothetical protein